HHPAAARPPETRTHLESQCQCRSLGGRISQRCFGAAAVIRCMSSFVGGAVTARCVAGGKTSLKYFQLRRRRTSTARHDVDRTRLPIPGRQFPERQSVFNFAFNTNPVRSGSNRTIGSCRCSVTAWRDQPVFVAREPWRTVS